ncbi:ABC transporter permease subunit [Ruminiclostridium cellulolyticum]|uniref:Putative ABC-2 type transport system permease protein n=1 Tax=Ruminiclostridium cellulolyticum (strain ATCC 35319 / DSM 5812 / JCM 6584 / H10) TaxID=394503 RepID=B8I467_RUMCH|nr:ABC transporter permease subunit [Ruminiclostridium cellulolyticum]ACL76500.1 putative ABC-2 type transport system permease protein [Ruminiclostridium cellulolyticum H10]
MNIYLHELKSMRRTAAIWTISLIALSALYLCIYPSIASDAEEFKKLLANYPPALRAMFGIDIDYITSILGFYSMVFSFITLCGSIQGMNLGISILSRESRERTADFLLVKPVSRKSIVSAKLLAAFTTIVATNVGFYVATILIVNAVKTEDYSNKLFLMINLTLFFMQIIFMSIGMVVSVFFNKLKSILPISLGVVFGFYLTGVIISIGKNVDAVRYISPFKYFDSAYIIKNASYEVSYLVASAVIVVTAIITSYIVYIKKDIHAV